MACFTEIKAHDTKDDQSKTDELQGGGGFAKVQYADYGYQSHTYPRPDSIGDPDVDFFKSQGQRDKRGPIKNEVHLQKSWLIISRITNFQQVKRVILELTVTVGIFFVE